MVWGSGDGGEDEIRRVFFNSGQMKHLAATQIVLLGCFFFIKSRLQPWIYCYGCNLLCPIYYSLTQNAFSQTTMKQQE